MRWTTSRVSHSGQFARTVADGNGAISDSDLHMETLAIFSSG
jgi:hypothetical protein